MKYAGTHDLGTYGKLYDLIKYPEPTKANGTVRGERRNEERRNETVYPLVHTIKPKGVLPGPSSVTELPFFSFIEKP